ncbi:MAG: sulfur carrier protein ThiS [Thermodesulfobacteriota bacterium]|nr:sulfur carrier protein ThiS [Thermodesulfobacteriota bacterium]MEE2975479.1 sulfur carrier protein ThiS [Thermodesulfobacteriota bacterium]|tara:strand:- start:1928 stop:2131 length:204 start_codon:yes stop_codon:yes gene_type:complete
MFKIILNGERIKLEKEMNLYKFLKEHFSSKVNFAVAVNGEFISKSKYKVTSITNGDEIEVVTAHPGG